MGERLNYRCSPSIVWVKDIAQTLVVDERTGQSWALRGAEAVIWDLLAVGYSYEGIGPILSRVLSLPVEEAERILVGVLRTWQDARIVQVSGEADDGEPDRQCSV